MSITAAAGASFYSNNKKKSTIVSYPNIHNIQNHISIKENKKLPTFPTKIIVAVVIGF